MVTMEEVNKRIGTIERAMDRLFLTTESFEDDLAFLVKYDNDNYKNVKFFAGLTKGCIVFDDLPYVIKCGLEGRSHYSWSLSSHTLQNEDDDCYGQDRYEHYEENAAFDELAIYEDFKSNNLEAILAKTWQYDDKFICAEKIDTIGDNGSVFSDIELTEEELKWKEDREFVNSSYWMDKAIKFYGIEYLDKFLDYAENYDFIIDLHSNNYGFNEKGEPKILDFGGCSLVF